MRNSYILLGMLAVVGSGLGLRSAAAGGGAPGGRFMERLNHARERARNRKPAPRAVTPSPATPSPASPSRPPDAAPPRQTSLPVPAPAGQSRPATSRPVVPGAYGHITPQPNPRSFKTARVTYSTTPRPVGSTSPASTGDLYLVAQPEDTRVFYYVNGGSQLPQVTTASMRERPAGKVSIMAYAPSMHGRVTAWIPIKAGQITTVRFVFPSRAGGPALPIPGER